ncbi:hypothetical protein DNJ95_06335 [Stutzerimonas kirkiae]|uniref:Uncharacterized protein n=1 Tax=Stutzerimonas kirkiae TaxID=2211392 RepID=A0A4Q9RCG2_9GAMM|nr:hypothetical protein [Stutzerimonas kirkiae]TBU98869.1 hypothetical protein DNJ96_03925 [Stutzerimonas kirkiae]TBV03963.1 hypothetical protein DNJ95_06335 [Stutzerimonas kirkiae]TBV16841.1 hypothetical protein DNK01_03045 [Stutzerimonas kirkiae]
MTDTPETPIAPAENAENAEQVPPAHPWAELAPERFRLLRLAPLAADKYTGPRPLRFVELAQVERHSPEESLLRLFIHQTGQKRSHKQNTLEVWADHENKTLRFGPESGLSIVPANRGLGRFLLAQAVLWAQKSWSHYLVEGGTLAENGHEEQRQLRDHFLQTQGFDVEYNLEHQFKGSYSAPRVSALRGDWNQDKVQIIELLDSASMLEQADQNLAKQEAHIAELQEQIAKYRREDGGLRFTIVCLIAFCLFQAGLLIWIATR